MYFDHWVEVRPDNAMCVNSVVSLYFECAPSGSVSSHCHCLNCVGLLTVLSPLSSSEDETCEVEMSGCVTCPGVTPLAGDLLDVGVSVSDCDKGEPCSMSICMGCESTGEAVEVWSVLSVEASGAELAAVQS